MTTVLERYQKASRRRLRKAEKSNQRLDIQGLPWENLYYRYTHKRRSFEFERELRAVCAFNNYEIRSQQEFRSPGPVVDAVSVDLDRLIEAVYVSPGAPKWFSELVTLVQARYDRTWPVIHSSIDSGPIY